MRKILMFGILTVSLVACSDSSADNGSREETTRQEEQTVAVIPNKIMTMEIDGMVCKMGCGGSIRKELKGANGVSKVEFDFEEERKTNTAKIYFDENKITEAKMIELVSKLNEGQFTVGETSTEDFVEVDTDETETSGSSDEVSIDAYGDDVSLPNLFDLFRGLFS